MTDTKPRPPGLHSPWVPRMLKLMARVQVWCFRKTGGRIGSKWRVGAGFRKPVQTLLLDHRGRKSGREFTTPLLYLEYGADVVIVASQGGLPQHPQWYRNLMAAPDTTIQIRRAVRTVRAREATAEERTMLWPLLDELYADFANYRSWTDREIPIVVLEPR
ncbi:MAG TPA: nitroreductase/quinone reductase family protein [Nocardioidaceae bacterium]|nr:nitroreductase/quinone reductase family protein [Nocardioidaceae bacterium]